MASIASGFESFHNLNIAIAPQLQLAQSGQFRILRPPIGSWFKISKGML
jgi:hypothetical protein